MRKTHTPMTLSAVALAIMATSTVHRTFAANFNITPTPGYVIPTTVYPRSTVHAFYTVTNNTNRTLSGYRLQGQPSTVSQNTSGNHCANPITLASRESCILQLDITGTAWSNFAICKDMSCSSAAAPLKVRTATTPPPPMIAAGSHSDGTFTMPLLAQSADGGSIWTYPPSIHTEFPGEVNDAFFESASCSGNDCIAAGGNYNGVDFIPLLAQSSDGGLTWTYPTSIQTELPSASREAGFLSSSCSGSICIAAGYDIMPGEDNVIPLLAQSTDGGLTWTYPPSIQDAFTENRNNARFLSASCSGLNCVAAGRKRVASHTVPLLAQSSDGGLTWTYPTSIHTAFPGEENDAYFEGVSCNGQYCVAAGYNFNEVHTIPLLAQSADGGVTWTYPPSIQTEFPGVVNDAYFKNVTCSGTYCVAAGYNYNGTNTIPLLAQSSTNGLTWTYPTSIQTELPGEASDAFFNSTSCSDNYCVAVGEDFNGDNTIPLLAQSLDGGVNWTYPSSIYTELTTPSVSRSFISTSCSGIYCIAAGRQFDGSNTTPLLARSADGGITWTYPSSIQTAFPGVLLDAAFGGTSVSKASLLPKALTFKPHEPTIHALSSRTHPVTAMNAHEINP